MPPNQAVPSAFIIPSKPYSTHYNFTLAIHQSTSTCVNMNTMSMKNVVIEQSSIVHIAKDHCFLRAPQVCCSFVLERWQCPRFQHRYGIHSSSQFGPQSRLARANDLQSLYDQELPRVWMGMGGYCRSCCKKYNVSARYLEFFQATKLSNQISKVYRQRNYMDKKLDELIDLEDPPFIYRRGSDVRG